MASLTDFYRIIRLKAKQAVGVEPVIACDRGLPLEQHGSAYGGWLIPVGMLSRSSTVLDFGLGEDISFSTSLIQKYGCVVHGFDPTPRSIAHVRNANQENFTLHEVAVGAERGRAVFHLPNDTRHISGALAKADHVGAESIEVEVVTLGGAMQLAGIERIDVLKVDIEGAEYDLLRSEEFRQLASHIGIICIEFHHRWPSYGRRSTEQAVAELRALGFVCVWRSATTNEEFTFMATVDEQG